ncbi:hypothetical protein [Phycicoccus duodecadis]|uniref:Peptidase n=1 Tax=Phycicoccus duodecadis TaxID=173053 RepID=A0A2N3YI87_9MICO|nr:hypothetical protein [Phycicoccus duodecadis]PKW26549.1 hypothetical protein ATL31_1362 [Phycicoccus duodecadis]
MRRLLTLIALVAGSLLPAAGAFGTPATTAASGGTGIGIRLVDAPVATRDNPRARVYIIDHVSPGDTVERHIEISNDTGAPAGVAVYAAAAKIQSGSFVGLEGDTPNDLSTWTTLSTPRLQLADGAKQLVAVTITVPRDAAPGEQYAVLWAQTTSGGKAAITQVSRVGIRVYLSVGPGGEPASAFTIESLTARRDASGVPTVAATVRNTGGRALDLSGTLTLDDGPGGLSAGPFPVTLGTTLGRGQSAPVTVALDRQLPAGPWAATLHVTSGLLTESAQASLTFPAAGRSGPVVPVEQHASLWWWVVLLLIVLLGVLGVLGAIWTMSRRRRRGGRHSLAALAARPAHPAPPPSRISA